MRGTIKGLFFAIFTIVFITANIFGFFFAMIWLFGFQINQMSLLIGMIGTPIVVNLFILRTGIHQVKKDHTQFGHGMIA